MVWAPGCGRSITPRLKRFAAEGGHSIHPASPLESPSQIPTTASGHFPRAVPRPKFNPGHGSHRGPSADLGEPALLGRYPVEVRYTEYSLARARPLDSVNILWDLTWKKHP